MNINSFCNTLIDSFKLSVLVIVNVILDTMWLLCIFWLPSGVHLAERRYLLLAHSCPILF